jgi:hypothetical protein
MYVQILWMNRVEKECGATLLVHTHPFPRPSTPNPPTSLVSCESGAREEETDRGGEKKKKKGLETASRQMPTESKQHYPSTPPPYVA